MKSIQEAFDASNLQDVDRLAVFRCTRKSGSYERNLNNLPQGRTDWWRIAEKQDFDGVAILLDSLDGQFIEVWAGKAVQPAGGPRLSSEAAAPVLRGPPG